MNETLTRLIACFCLAAATSSVLAQRPQVYEITVEAGKHDRVNVPMETFEFGAFQPTIKLVGDDGLTVVGQVFSPRPMSRRISRIARFVVPKLTAGEKRIYRVELTGRLKKGETEAKPVTFSWHHTPGESTELRFGDRPVLRYMYRTYDGSTPESHELTKKVFHHVFDPTTGKQLLTKGPGGLYSHHRGIFYGFSQLRYGDGKTADVWHCNRGESQRHMKIDYATAIASLNYGYEAAILAGPVFALQRAVINWHGTDGEVFAKEGRKITAFNVPGGTLLEFESTLISTDGPLEIDGDPQHAGFQFRAAQEVAEKTKDQTYYLRPDGRDKPGVTRNWDHKNIGEPSNKQTENLPWNAMSFVVGGKRYTALYLDHPDNPKPARYSERDYGRFGSYFATKIEASKTLAVRYRLWIQEGEMTARECARLSADFVDPPTVSVRRVTDAEQDR